MFPIRDHEPAGRFPAVTIGIIAANVLVFIQQLTTADPEAFVRMWALVPTSLHPGNPLTFIPFITSQFLHAGFAHIGFNLWFLWIFGDNVEARMGRARFLAFYLTSGVIAALAQLPLIAGTSIPMLGASGAIAGVLGAYWALFPRHRVDALVPDLFGFFWTRATLPASVVLVFWFVSQLLNGTATIIAGSAASGGVAFFAHAGGFAFGWLIARPLRRKGVRMIDRRIG